MLLKITFKKIREKKSIFRHENTMNLFGIMITIFFKVLFAQ